MLRPLAPDDAGRLRRFFTEAGYTQEGLRQTLVVNELAARNQRNLPRLLDRTRERTALHLLMRWFCVGVPVELRTAEEVIPAWVLPLLLEGGMLSGQGESLAPRVMLAPFEELLIATDPSLKIEAGGDPDAVLIINPTTWLLYRFSVRRPSRATLDLGTGCGVLALAALRYSRSVVAADINSRATEFAAFNARLNGCDNVECVTGDGFAPVEGRKFDLILTNPPFFVSPVARFRFCENDMELDQFCRRLVRQAPDYLNEGGMLQMVCEWVEVQGQPWQERIAEWMAGISCDAWVIKGHSEEPSLYAHSRIRETTIGSPEADARNYSEWMAYYRDRKVQAIHRGLIALRRRDGRNWLRFDEMPATPREPFGDSVLDGFSASDLLDAHPSDAELSGIRPAVSLQTRLDRRWEFADGRWQVRALHLYLSSGLPHAQKVESPVAELLAALGGERSLGDAIDSLIASRGGPREELRGQFLAAARRLIECGFLRVPGRC